MFAKCSPDLFSSTLLDKTIFDNRSLLHEYFLLAKEQFANISKKDQEILLSWIETGMDLKTYVKKCKQFNQEYKKENGEKYIKEWQLDRLAPIRDSLPTDWKE